MMGLWADGWFYISSAGLLISGVLFFFLLGQYRAASEAADVTDGEQGSDIEFSVAGAIRPVYIPDEAPAPQVVSHPMTEPEAKPKPDVKAPEVKSESMPRSEGESAAPERRKDSMNAAGSPAVVYLESIKGELAELHQEMRALSKRVDGELAAVSTRDTALIGRLGDLTRAVEKIKVAAAAAQDASEPPAPKKVGKAEKAAEPIPEPAPAPIAAPAPEPKAEPVRSADETIRMELGALIAPTPAQPEPKTAVVESTEPAPASPEAPPEEKPRRGPVWPV